MRDIEPLNVVSFFDGMSCGMLALIQAQVPVKNYYAFEIDKYAIQVSKNNFPNIIQCGSVTEAHGFLLPKTDLFIGGSPCQGFSFAGKQLNFNDPRSALFFEYVRVLNELKEENPDIYFLLENVVMKQEYQDVISNLLGVKPILINSALVSAQIRRRLYWTNIPQFGQPTDKNLGFKDIFEENANVFYYTENSFNWIFKDIKRKSKYYEYSKFDTCKVQMIEASHYKGYSNQRCFGVKDSRGIRYISPIECERAQTVPDNYTGGVSNTQRYKMLGNGWNVDTIAHLFQGLNCDEYYL